MSYLAIRWKTVIDSAAVEAVLDGNDVEVTPATPEVSHEELDACYVEDDVSVVARNMADSVLSTQFEFFEVEISGRGTPTLHAVQIKTGTRAAAPKREIAEIEANNRVVGSTEVNA